MIDRTSIVIFLAGGAAGAAVALLMAPQAGIDTRQRIGRTFRDTADSALDLTERLVQRGEDISDEAARRIQGASSALTGRGSRKTPGNGDEAAAT